MRREYCVISILEVVHRPKDCLKNNKSSGNDGITADIYKMFAQNLSTFLSEDFKASRAARYWKKLTLRYMTCYVL